MKPYLSVESGMRHQEFKKAFTYVKAFLHWAI